VAAWELADSIEENHTCVQILLDHGADCNLADIDRYNPLTTALCYIESNNMNHAILNAMLMKTYPSEDVCLAMHSCLTHCSFDTPEEINITKSLLQHLPELCLKSVNLVCDYEDVTIVLNQNQQYSPGHRSGSITLNVACLLLLETTMTSGGMLPTVTNKNKLLDRKTQDQQFIRDIDKVVNQITDMALKVCPLTKLCTINIRKYMHSKDNVDYDMLGLPSTLRSQVTFEYMVDELHEMWVKHKQKE
jgi:hypothetical protein